MYFNQIPAGSIWLNRGRIRRVVLPSAREPWQARVETIHWVAEMDLRSGQARRRKLATPSRIDSPVLVNPKGHELPLELVLS